jgi:membrane protease YdiL (CAAX protease family)
MNRLLDFVRKERLYLLILIFVLTVNAIVALSSSEKPRPRRSAVSAAEKAATEKAAIATPAETEAARREKIEKIFAEDKYLTLIVSLTSLLIVAVLLLGLVIDIILAAQRLAGKRLDIRTYRLQAAAWGVWDVAKVVILFLFFGYILIMIESVLVRPLPILRDDNFRMILNSSVLDTLGVVLILYFTVGVYRERLAAVGLSLRNFTRNVFYGVTAYIAIVPVLILTLGAIAFFSNLIKYVPEKQPVVELFLKEKNTTFLAYTSVFAAMVGPMIEELFFRGFMYNAFKKRVGIFAAMLITAATFAALHAHAVGFLPIMILGMVLAYLYEKTGTLVSSITVHMIHNLSMVFLVFLVKHMGTG